MTERRSNPKLTSDGIFYGWVVTAASLCITSTAFGVLYSFGVFFKAWTGEWASSRALLSGIFSLTFLMYGVASVLMGTSADRYGPRITLAVGGIIMGSGCVLTALAHRVWPLYITWGGMVGVGVGTSYAPTATTVSRWFIKQRGLAVGIVVSGLGLGTLIFSPLSEALIGAYGWRRAAVYLGFIIWIVYLCGALVMRRDPHELGLTPLGADTEPEPSITKQQAKYDCDKENDSKPPFESFNLNKAMRSANFWSLFSIHCLWVLGMSIPMVHLVPYATDLGVATSRAATMLAVVGGMSVLGRVVLGVLTEKVETRFSLTGLLCFQTATMAWLIASDTEWMLWLFSLAFGFSYGGLASVFPLATSELFGLEAMGSIFGFILLGATLGGTIGPILAGYLFDLTRNYYGAFLAGIFSMGIGAVLPLFFSSALSRPITTNVKS